MPSCSSSNASYSQYDVVQPSCVLRVKTTIKIHIFGCHRVTFCWHRTCFRCSLAVDQVRGHLRAKFKIPYSYGHLVSISGQCDASIGQMLAFLSVSKARIYKLYFFRQCINIVYISFPRSYFHRVTCFVINEYKSECSVVSAIRDVMPVPQKALNNQVLTTMAI